MNEAISPALEGGLKALHKRWAVFATRRLRFIHPELTLTLYGTDMALTIHVANCGAAAFPALAKYFGHDVRPMTCNIRLSQATPQFGVPIEEVYDYEAEFWLDGVPLSVPDLNRLLSFAEPDFSTLPSRYGTTIPRTWTSWSS